MYFGLRHPNHSGSFVRECGGWGAYHNWCVENGFGVWDTDGQITLKNVPIRTDRKVGRNSPCLCGSGRKYKKCCLNA